jgi:flagellar biosynthetic protein FliQ
MSEQQVIDIARRAVFLIIECSAPLLIISLVVGLIISIFQTVTSIQEQTLTFVPKIVAVFFGVMLLGSWIINNITSYMNELWSNFNMYIGRS